MISTSGKISAICLVGGLIGWYASTQVTDNPYVQLAVLLGIGVVLPTAINEFRGEGIERWSPDP